MLDLGLSLFKISLGSFSLVNVSLGSPAQASAIAPSSLAIPFRSLQKNPRIFDLLDWRLAITKMIGRDVELASLHNWANSEPAVSIKIISGPGGVGKSRLAAQFAKELGEEGWAAGFIKLGDTGSYRLGENGTLIVIDYPEERTLDLEALFTDLAALDGSARLRILFLSRVGFSEWQERIVESKISSLIDHEPIILRSMAPPDARDLINFIQEAVADLMDTSPEPFSEEMAQAWLEENPAHHRPLFLMALGIFSAFWPEEKRFSYSAPSIIDALVEREMHRLRSLSKALTGKKNTLPCILAIATMTKPLPWDAIRTFSPSLRNSLGITADWDFRVELTEAGWLRESVFEAIQPDIIGAGFVGLVLKENRHLATELVRQAMLYKTDEQWVDNFARISMDLTIELEISPTPAEILSHHIEALENCDTFFKPLWFITPPHSMAALCLAACENGLKCPRTTPTREAELLAQSAGCYLLLKKTRHAVQAIERVLIIHERLAKKSPTKFLPRLAGSLSSASNCYLENGEPQKAVNAIERAVEINSKLTQNNPAYFLPLLALSLNNASTCYLYIGETQKAVDTIEHAVEIREKLAEDSPARFLPSLALSLSNASNCYIHNGELQKAIKPIERAVEIREKLAEDSPAQFWPDLALSYHNAANCYINLGELQKALDSIGRAMEIREKLANGYPTRFIPDLAISIGLHGKILERMGKLNQARDCLRKGRELVRSFAEAYPGSPADRTFLNLSKDLAALEDLE